MAELNIPTETEKIQNFVLVRYKRTAKASSFPLTLKRGRVEESRPRLQRGCFKMAFTTPIFKSVKPLSILYRQRNQ